MLCSMALPSNVCAALHGQSNVGSGNAIMLCSMALPSNLCAALHGQSNVGSMRDCNSCRSFNLFVWVKMLSGVDSDHGTGPNRYGSVNSRSTLCPI